MSAHVLTALLFQRIFRGHVQRVQVRLLRLAIAEAIKRAFAERMACVAKTLPFLIVEYCRDAFFIFSPLFPSQLSVLLRYEQVRSVI